MMRLWIVSGVLCACAAAQPPEGPPKPWRAGGDLSEPRLVFRQEPLYAEEARIARLQGTVLLSLTVGEDGVPRDLRVRKSLGMGLDENAVAAVSHWRFSPAIRGGQPVSVESNVEVSYHLLTDEGSWRVARSSYRVPQGATQPVLVRAQYPTPLGPEPPAAVSVSFDVNEQGIPTNIRVASSSAPEVEDEVTALIREWRFMAALMNGIPVAARGTLDFGRGPDSLPRPVTISPEKRYEVPM